MKRNTSNIVKLAKTGPGDPNRVPPPDFNADERRQWAELCDQIHNAGGLIATNSFVLESIVRERRTEKQARALAEAALAAPDGPDVATWRTATAAAARSAAALRAALRTLKISTEHRSGKATKAQQADAVAKTSAAWADAKK